MDVGWNRTAALWGAIDRDSDILYLYSEHYMGHNEPLQHAEAIMSRGKWIPGVIDPAARGRGQKDGESLLHIYQQYLPNLTTANNAVEAGIYAVWVRMASGRFKVFSTLQHYLGEFRIYRRDDKGNVVKDNDHLQDCARYLCASGLDRATNRPPSMWNVPGSREDIRHQFEYDPLKVA